MPGNFLRRLFVSFALASLLLAMTLAPVSSPSSAIQTTDTAARLHSQVEAIVAGMNSAERGAAITRQLEKLDVRVRTQPFQKQQRRGRNIIAELPGTAAKTLMIGAHYDRVAVGRGAVDNAASCAMLLDLISRLKKSPLQAFNVHVAFWDLEEGGLHGSQAFVEAAKAQQGDELELPDAYINFDVFAYGDTLWVMSPQGDAPLARAVRTAGESTRFPVRVGQTYPPSDHLSFIRVGVPTIAISLIDGSEIDRVIGTISGGREAPKPDKPPRVLAIIHTANDTIDKVDTGAIEKALPTVEQLLRIVDSQK